MQILPNRHELERLGTSWTTEIVAGVSLFMSLSYIFIVNPSILSQAGIPSGAVFFATVLASGVATLAMGLYARLPFALAPGLESNGFFAFVVVASLGFSWQEALGLVFWSGVLCFFFTVIPVRQRIIDAIPEGLKAAISTTVGVFVAIIGFAVTDLVAFTDGLPSGFGDFASAKALLLYAGFATALVLGLRSLNFPAGMLVAIILCTVLARLLGVSSDTPPAHRDEFFAAIGEFELFSVFSDPRSWTVLLVFFAIDFFGSIGKFIGLTRETNLQSGGQVAHMKEALYVDGVGTAIGSALGTSTVITYVESAVAVAQGGRTGVVAIVCALLMFASLAFSPLVAFVPVAAASGVLVYVGWLLLPRRELLDAIQGQKDIGGTLDYFDFAVVLAMGVLAGITFSLDKSLLLGFWAYTVAGAFGKGRAFNFYLLACSVVLSTAMGFQYFGME